MKTQLLTENIAEAARLVKEGGLVGVPTETVYGLAGSGLDAEAVNRIYEVKGRPQIKPLSLMVPDASAMDVYCRDVPEAARALAARFWPGPLTIVLKARDTVPDIVRAGGATVGLRCPDSEKTLELLRLCGLPLAAPSANPSGEKSPVTAAEVMSYFDGSIDAVIDGGVCRESRESTIIDMSAVPYRILRAGALGEEEIFAALTDSLRVIGITGGTGCGKTTALNVLSELGALIIDCDEVYHKLTESSAELLAELESRFPGSMENGVLQRKKLGEAVFSDPEALLSLNALTHRYVSRETDRLLQSWALDGGRLAAIDAIALIESGIGEKCSVIVGITAPREERVRRLMAREGISRGYAEKRIAAQKTDEFFKENCDCIIHNGGTREEFEKSCLTLFKTIITEDE